VPSTIGLFVFQFIQGYINMFLSNALDQMAEAPWFVKYLIMAISGQGVLWFAQMLWLFSVMLVGVRKLEKDRGWQLGKKINLPILLLLTGAVWLSAQSGNTPVIVVYRFGLYNTLYFLGYFIFSHQEVMEVVKKNFWLFLVLTLSLGVGFCFYSFGKNYADEPVYRSVLFTSYSWLGCLAILGGFGRYFDFETGFTRWMSRHSFGLYIFHYLGISAVALFMAKPGLLAPLSVYLLSTLAGFAVGYLLPMIIARLPFISWAVLGIKKKG
jgi:surface polysaccharide O-acyltransferase-like enzyme